MSVGKRGREIVILQRLTHVRLQGGVLGMISGIVFFTLADVHRTKHYSVVQGVGFYHTKSAYAYAHI